MNKNRALMRTCQNAKPAVCVAAATLGSLPMMKDGKGTMSRVIGSMKENVFQDSLSPIFCPSGLLITVLKWKEWIQDWRNFLIPHSFYLPGQLKEGTMLA